MTGNIAVLIDADNAQPCKASLVLAEVAKYGTTSVKRAYGDWTGPNLKGWKDQLLHNSIQPIQQFAYTKGKNSTDAAMVIDAMDLLHSTRLDGFCLVSSDSDFTRLAARIRESGLTVYGCGVRMTPKPFVAACDKFIYIENLTPNSNIIRQVEDGTGDGGVESAKEHLINAAEMLRGAVEATSDHDGWAGVCEIGDLLVKRHPDFDSRSFGYKKLTDLIAALDDVFEICRRSLGEGKQALPYVRKRTNGS
ncbi:hypothetical protein NQ176_g3398 [Zarea fungicola]|uniref:Uncharacterized protein n=2 Tax=Zarea fungicola TaxID=93591 RepID=A0ACC1NG36_9HYPO|nr:hypothetical protein NQ176_g3926 [Lecanicillium fungicola]KAJ2979194.1 hypothetical protein NQ176_g3398 [Lecanicillium fungicola]